MSDAVLELIYNFCYFVGACITMYGLVRLNEFRIHKEYFLLREGFVLVIFALGFFGAPLMGKSFHSMQNEGKDNPPVIVTIDRSVKVAAGY